MRIGTERLFSKEMTILGTAPEDNWEVRLDLLEHMQNLVVLCKGTAIAFVNSLGAEWLGYDSPEDLIGIELKDLLHVDYQDLTAMGMGMLTEEIFIPLKVLRLDHTELDVDMWVNKLDVAGDDVFLVEARDITEHLRAARALKSREQRLEGIINTVADGIITLNDKGTIQTFNPAAERIFRFSAGEIIGRNIRTLIPTPAEETASNDLGLDWQKVFTKQDEMEGKRKSGEAFPIEMSVRELKYGSQLSFTGVVRDITARKKAEEHIRNLAHHDSLTGLPNRFLFGDRLDEAVSRSKRHNRAMALLFLDLNKFKPINDQFGHAVGDMVLVKLAERLKKNIRETDTVARIGGDEFVVIVEDIQSRAAVEKITQKVLSAFDRPVSVQGKDHVLSASVGISLCPEHTENPEKLIHFADFAMYQIKDKAKTNYCFFNPSMIEPDD